MIVAPIPEGDAERVRNLARYSLDDPELAPMLHQIAELAAHALGASVGLVSVVDADYQHFRGRYGTTAEGTPRAISFCAHVVASEEDLVVPDAVADPRFADSPLVLGPPHTRLYVGTPLRSESGDLLGTLCVVDSRTLCVDEPALAQLRRLARLLARHLETHRGLLRARQYQALHDATPALVVSATFDGYFREVSRYWTDVLGYTRADLTARPFNAFVHPDDRESTAAALATLAVGGELTGYKNRYMDASGEPHWFSWYARSDLAEGLAYAVAHDVSAYQEALHARDQAERELRAASRLIAAVSRVQEWHIGGRAVETVMGELCRSAAELTDSTGAFVCEARWGDGAWLASDRAIGAWGAVPADPRALLEAALGLELAPVASPVTLIVPLRRDSHLNGFLCLVGRGRGYDADDTAFVAPLVHAASSLLVARQEAARRSASEQALRESEIWFRALAQFAPFGIFRTDSAGRFVYANPKFVEFLGVSPSTPTDRWAARIEPDDFRRVASRWLAAVKQRLDFLDEVRVLPVYGETERRTLLLQGTPIGSQDGRHLGYVGMAVDISDRKRVERLQQEFIATVSHELRTPLTSIRGALGLLSGGLVGELPQGAREMVGVALTNSERLIRLVSDILDTERVRSGALDVALAPIDLAELAVRATRDLAGFAAQHRVTFDLDLTEPLLIDGDADRLLQVLSNLLSNAAKFSPPDGRVHIGARVTEAQVLVQVSDQGPGIPAAFVPRLFDRFARADNTDTRRRGGSGLGLAISKAIVDRHGGELTYAANTSGGSTFTLALPRRHSGP